jgi:16S rRNA (uracil1498-N3)-methyltransferase
MKTGDKLRLFNGDGNFYPATITETKKKSLTVHIESKEPATTESNLHTHIGQVMSRGDRMDYAIQKSTEMGVKEITPLFSERCEVKLNAERAEKRRLHWEQVAISAAEQCGRASIPSIHSPVTLEEWIKNCTGLSLVLHHRDTQNLSTLDKPDSVNLLIGPEGGLSEHEIEQAKNHHFIAATLGPRVLRTETAPVTALSIIQWLWGDFQK